MPARVRIARALLLWFAGLYVASRCGLGDPFGVGALLDPYIAILLG